MCEYRAMLYALLTNVGSAWFAAAGKFRPRCGVVEGDNSNKGPLTPYDLWRSTVIRQLKVRRAAEHANRASCADPGWRGTGEQASWLMLVSWL